MAYDTIIVEKRGEAGLITLNRPKALNALNGTVLNELTAALNAMSEDAKIGAVVITGSEKAFAAGADVKEMSEFEFASAYMHDALGGWEDVAAFPKPMIAAVSGYALGGGCELASMCDFIIAGESAKFGQPEVTLGIMPGMGGTQRLARSIGKAKTMDLCLTGRMMDAEEAERCGLVARVVPDTELIEEAISAAQKIASYSLPSVMMVKETINQAFETGLAEGLRFERRLFHAMFALDDQSEGMAAFIDKRTPSFRNR
ncbi:MAG: enoyl-CoA hydratase [Roseitalea sp.]|jgi:enoyl-CoA hydratase|nr:enoyl-CoA hydratase [Roseitalea sp.]MBO6722904.1 enoyl-CoA hydratase [Roseitalea sp.]MBO6745062.1 enoyl-CoA hydratase [Roseitalea sp.]